MDGGSSWILKVHLALSWGRSGGSTSGIPDSGLALGRQRRLPCA